MAKDKPNQMQVEVPPMTRPGAGRPLPADEARKYLNEAGWTEQGRDELGNSFWSDPAGEGPKTGTAKKTTQLPQKDGADPLEITQVVCNPVSWTHPMHEAVSIQRARDQAAAKSTAAA